MGRRTTRDVTLVVRVWKEPDDDELRARLLTTSGGDERTAVGMTAIVGLIESALHAFAGDEG